MRKFHGSRSGAVVLLAALLLTSGGPTEAAQVAVAVAAEFPDEGSAEAKSKYAVDALAEMTAAVSAVEAIEKVAQQGGDPVEVDCVTTKMRAIRGLLAVSTIARDAMNAALAEGDIPLADHEGRKIAASIKKVRQFKAEAEGCTGAAAESQGETIWDFDGYGEGGTDETEPAYVEGVDPGDPPATSPFE